MYYDGLTGFKAIEALVRTRTTAQTLRGPPDQGLDAVRSVFYKDRKKAAAALQPIYTAPTIEAAETELLSFAESDPRQQVQGDGRGLGNGWEPARAVPGVQPELRRIIYTTSAIESLDYQFCKISENRCHFPNDAVIKLLWLAIRDIEDKRARQRAKEAGLPAKRRKAPPKLVEGAIVQGWKAALGTLALAYPGRLS